MKAECSLSEERLITTDGTIIPQAVRFANGNMVVIYHVGNDAYFSPSGSHRSRDNGATWERMECPLHRGSAMGAVGDARALFFDQYLLKTGDGEYAAFYNETRDSGETFPGPKTARFSIKGVLDREYVPRSRDDPDYFFEPDVPDFYEPVTAKHGSVIGGHIFGRILRLPDGALGLSAYCAMEGNMTRLREHSAYVGARQDEATAPEATGQVLDSSVFFRSEDDGQTWRYTDTIGRARPGKPFDAGKIYSEGLNETGLSCTADGNVYALIRHGSYMLLWWSMSKDCGRTWSDIKPLNYPGVAPSVVLMPNGVVAAAWGRPGMTVAFSLDGTARNWDVLVGVADDSISSQKYPWVVPVGDNRLMLLYDKRKWDPEKRRLYDHGIYCRELTVEPRSA